MDSQPNLSPAPEYPAPAPPPVAPPPKRRHPFVWVLFGALGVILLLGAYLVYAWLNVQWPFQRVPEMMMSETAVWNTYRNDTYGLEFKYPKDWQEPRITVSGTGAGSINISLPDQDGNLPIQMVNVEELSGTLEENTASFLIDPRFRNISWEKRISFENGEAFYYVNTGGKPGPIPTAYLVGTGQLWIINADPIELESVLLSILSTFRFTEADPTADLNEAESVSAPAGLKWFRSERYGFEMLIPDDLTPTVDIVNDRIVFQSPQSIRDEEERVRNCDDGDPETICISESRAFALIYRPRSSDVGAVTSEFQFGSHDWIEYDAQSLFGETHYKVELGGRVHDFEPNFFGFDGVLDSFRVLQ